MEDSTIFRYKVALRNTANPAKQKTMTIEAKTEDAAFSIGNKQVGWEVIGASLMGTVSADKKSSISLSFLPQRQKKFPQKDLIRFCKGLATMLRADISTVDSLNFYAASIPNKEQSNLIKGISSDIEFGENPDVAFSKTGWFNNIFTGMVKAGVTAGNLAGALEAIAHQMQIMSSFKSRLRKIIMIPTGVIIFLFGMFITAQNLVTPRIENMLAANRVSPDPFSAAIFAMSHAVQNTWVVILMIIIAIIVTLVIRKDLQAFLLNFFMNKWKLLRTVIMSMRQLTFIGTLSMLQNNKIVMDESLRVCINVMKGSAMEKEIENVRTQYSSGIPVSECVKRFTSCEPTVVHMMAIGEKTANLPEQLRLCAKMLEEQADESMSDFSAITSLFSTIVPVLIIGFIFLSSYLPIVLMSAKLMQGFSDR